MDEVLKTKWLTALRSGDYKQGTEQLRSEDNCYCCLGVLCDVNNGNLWHKEDGGYVYKGSGGYSLGEIMSCKIGISDYVENNLIKMNDTEHKTFIEIANYIEKNL